MTPNTAVEWEPCYSHMGAIRRVSKGQILLSMCEWQVSRPHSSLGMRKHKFLLSDLLLFLYNIAVCFDDKIIITTVVVTKRNFHYEE